MTTLIAELREGNDRGEGELVTLVYPELRRIAAHYMRQERPGHTLRTTGLVNEMYVRLFGRRRSTGKAVPTSLRPSRVRCGTSSSTTRAREMRRSARTVGWRSRSATPIVDAGDQPEDLLALDEALSRLEAMDLRASRVVELRYLQRSD